MLSKHFSVGQAIEWVDCTVYTLVLLSHAVRDLVGVCAEHVCIFLCRFCAPHSKDPITVAFVSSLADVDWWQYFIYVWCCAFCLHSHPTYLLTKTVLWGQRCLLSAGRPGPRCWRLPFSSGKWEVGHWLHPSLEFTDYTLTQCVIREKTLRTVKFCANVHHCYFPNSLWNLNYEWNHCICKSTFLWSCLSWAC